MAKQDRASKPASAKRRSRKQRPEARSKGLTPAECAEKPAASLEKLTAIIDQHGGRSLATYREPLGGKPLVLAALPIDKVTATPFQRDLSESHSKRMTDTISKLGCYLDPIVVVPAGEAFWTPNGRHRLEAMTRLGAKAIMALVLPEADIQYKILALNVEKAHNLREKALEVIRMYRIMAGQDGGPEVGHAFEFEEPAFATLGICYEKNGRFAGGVYHPILRRIDGWLEQSLREALDIREQRAAKLEKLDLRIAEIVQGLKEKGFQSPYLKSFVVARINPLRFMKTMPAFNDALDDLIKRAGRFNVDKVKREDIVATAAPLPDEE